MKQSNNHNRGSAAVEAALALPLFLFAMLTLYHMHQSVLAEACVYEACAETAEYTAEYCFIGKANAIVPSLIFSKYLDDPERVERYVEGGLSGVHFLFTHMDDETLVLEADYRLRISVPFFPELHSRRHVTIRQRAYVGDTGSSEEKETEEEAEKYCFVTDNREVYHLSRGCTHLELTITAAPGKSYCETAGLSPCSYCGGKSGENYFITDEGNCYHKSLCCSGLKRTVYRIPLSEAKGLPPCGRCGIK